MVDKLQDAADDQVEENYDDLAYFVMDAFHRAKRHKDSVGVTESIVDCLRRFRGKYSKEELCKFQGISVYRGMTGMLVRSAVSWLKDAYFNAQDRPWTLEPTPEPSLPPDLEEELAVAIENVIAEQLGGGGGAPSGLSGFGKQSGDELLQSEISKLRNTASQLAYNFALEKTKAMSKVIEDQLIESDFRKVLSAFILDLCIFPVAVLKGPVIRRKQIPVWDGDKYKFDTRPVYEVDRVDPSNIYPSPDSTTPQDGEFIIEIMNMSRSELNDAKSMKDFKKDAINLVLEEQRNAYRRQAELRTADGEKEDLDGVGRTETSLEGSVFDVYEYHGRIRGEYLIEFHDLDDELDRALEKFEKVETPWGMIDPYLDYETTVWVCNGVVIMARLNSSKPIPYRPYYATSAYKVPGSFYGESPVMVVADLQDELNTAARARVYNMGMASGPIVEVDQSRFPDNDTPESILPWTVYVTQSNGTQSNNNHPAMRVTQFQSLSGELTAVMDEIWDKAHSIAGIPPYMYGESQGAAPTLGAFSLQYAGATKGIKNVIANIDHDIVEELISQMYYYNMYYNEDDTIKADANVNVRGSAGLIAQEQRQARPLELLQALGPILAQMQPETALALANETLSESGYDPATLGMNKSSAQKEAANTLVGQNTQTPPTDGRSGNASQVADQAQLQQLAG